MTNKICKACKREFENMDRYTDRAYCSNCLWSIMWQKKNGGKMN